MHCVGCAMVHLCSFWTVMKACRDAASLHRAVAFISANTAVVAKLLTTAQHSKNSGQVVSSETIFAALAYTSALLGDTAHATIQYSEAVSLYTSPSPRD